MIENVNADPVIDPDSRSGWFEGSCSVVCVPVRTGGQSAGRHSAREHRHGGLCPQRVAAADAGRLRRHCHRKCPGRAAYPGTQHHRRLHRPLQRAPSLHRDCRGSSPFGALRLRIHAAVSRPRPLQAGQRPVRAPRSAASSWPRLASACARTCVGRCCVSLWRRRVCDSSAPDFARSRTASCASHCSTCFTIDDGFRTRSIRSSCAPALGIATYPADATTPQTHCSAC